MMPTRLSSLPSYGLGFGTAVEKTPPGPAVITTLQVVTAEMVGQGTAFAEPPPSPPAARTVLASRYHLKLGFIFPLPRSPYAAMRTAVLCKQLSCQNSKLKDFQRL